MRKFFTSIRRTPYQSLTAFLILCFTLFLSTAIFVSLSFLDGILGYIESRPQVTVYFQTKTPEETIFKVRDELTNSDKVLSMKYVSKNDAYNLYKELNKDNPLLLEMVSADILPPSLEIFAKKPIYLPEIAEFLKKQDGVDEVQFQKDIVDRLLILTTILRKASIIFFAYLLIMAVVVLTTTTLFKIALKKDEIELLRLLGASNFYIIKPFLGEGLFLGFSASLASFLALTGIIFYLAPFVSGYLSGIPSLMLNFDFFQIQVWPINPLFLGVAFGLSTFFGMFIAAIANIFAAQKYLKA